MKTKVGKYLLVLSLVAIVAAGLYYLNLSNRHKAIVKTTLFYKLGLVDNTWNVIYTDTSTTFITPTFVVDNIYKSMEGPKALSAFQLKPSKSDLVWINSFKTTAISTNENDVLSNDYICHSNVDYFDGEHYGKWNLNDRIGTQYPRLTSMSNGVESYRFPEGFGFPVFTDENLFFSSQALNHNITSHSFSIKHRLQIGYQPHSKNMKPLMSKTIFVSLPILANTSNMDFNSQKDTNACLPVDMKNHMYLDDNGNMTSGHWYIFPGKSTYRSKVTKQLALTDSTSLHFIVSHLHPFSESLSLRDLTMDSTLFTSYAENYMDKTGLIHVTTFSSKAGITLYQDHEYELVVDINNTSNETQDMMASMFVFFYDKDMDEQLKNYKGL